jgi:hypothetical protein
VWRESSSGRADPHLAVAIIRTRSARSVAAACLHRIFFPALQGGEGSVSEGESGVVCGFCRLPGCSLSHSTCGPHCQKRSGGDHLGLRMRACSSGRKAPPATLGPATARYISTVDHGRMDGQQIE